MMAAGGVSADDWQSVVPAARRSGLLAATALIALVAASAAATAAPEGGGNAARAAAASAPQAFAIPPQPLKAALTAFAQQSGLQISFDSAAAVGLRSPGVSGAMIPEAALSRLLLGTGVSYRFSDSRTVILSRRLAGPARIVNQAGGGTAVLETIEVQGKKGGQSPYGPVDGYVAKNSSSATKGNTPIIETPQTVSVVTRQQIEAQQAQTTRDVVAYAPGVYFSDDADFRFQRVFSRGFQIDTYLNGLRVFGGTWSTPRMEPYFAERVEILKGPASILYGAASPGGVLSYGSKLPVPEAFGEIQFVTGNRDRIQGMFDVGGPIDKEGRLLYRVTGIARTADAQVDYLGDQRIAIAPALTWRPNDDTTFTVLTSYLHDPKAGYFNQLPYQGTLLPNQFGQIPRNFYVGDPSFESFKLTQYLLGYQFEHRFDDVWTVRQNFRYAHSDISYREVQLRTLPLIPPGFPVLGPASDRNLQRTAFTADENLGTVTVDNQAEAKFETGPLRHTVLMGIDYQHLDWTNFTRFGNIPQSLDWLDPNYNQVIPLPGVFQDQVQEQSQLGIYAQDQIKLGQWVFLIGGRQDWAKNSLENRLTARTTVQEDKAFTWRAGALYLFENGVAPYFSYATSFQPASGAAIDGSLFKPTTGEQYEVGIKYQPVGINGFMQVSLFDLTQQNVVTPDPLNGNALVQVGEIRSRGVEVSGVASLAQGLDIRASYTYLDSVITKNVDARIVGRLQGNTPPHVAKLWADYTFQDGPFNGFGFGGGIKYVSSTYATNGNSVLLNDLLRVGQNVKIPSYTLLDLTVHQDLGKLVPELKGFRAQINVTNLLDKTYVSTCSNFGCLYGMGRTVLGTLAYRW
jgi:iron complex outermembrane recepter protein